MTPFLTSFFILVLVLSVHGQVDPDVNPKTKSLLLNLKKIQPLGKILFGQEFFNSFQYSSGSAHGNKDFSDSKDVTGSHPAVLGSDFHYYLEKSTTERNYHTEAVKWAYQQGCIITFDWHISARGTSSYQYNGSPPGLLNNIVTDSNGDRAWFLGELDKVIQIINNDLIVNNDTIPIVFRPFHEMNGNWFWWGSAATNSSNYKAFYQLTVNYMRDKVKSVLFCWSPNYPLNFDYYPGDEYVDVIGLDYYEATPSTLQSQLGLLVDFANGHNKIAALTETGNRISNDNAGLYWNNTILPAILNDPTGKSRKISWMLTWINAGWSYPYVPYSGSGQVAKSSFKVFRDAYEILFANELPDLYLPDLVITGVSQPEGTNSNYLLIYPVPAKDKIDIEISGLDGEICILFQDVNGKQVMPVIKTTKKKYAARLSDFAPGTYVVIVWDNKSTIRKSFMISGN